MRFKKGDVIRHFKREMLTKEQIEENGALFTYEFLGVEEHTEKKKNWCYTRLCTMASQ